ncbi:MAG TPA: tRNA epoxyqueuosine(34) reductase QueG [Pseudolabrys sp.]|nr:tRNA epoxyqueuosine(34) reductase QueG [Pseudolabrys sp.]
MTDPPALKAALRQFAREQGFDAFGVTRPQTTELARRRFSEFIASGEHGDMDWLATHADRRIDPNVLWPDARSVIMLGMNYGPDWDPLAVHGQRDRGAISVYAHCDSDYHDVIKKRLKVIARWLIATAGGDLKVFVDTAPVMEKPLSQAAGLGWQGKHTNLVSRDFGSWLFLGAIFTTLDLPVDDAGPQSCGSCRACLDACPTNAFPSPFTLDARKCISYLTIEHKGPIPRDLRARMGNRIYGCDDCLAVCPWNKFAQAGRDAKLAARAQLRAPSLQDLARLDDAAFRTLFAKTAVKRTGRDRFVRNVLIAIGNSGEVALAAEAERLLDDASPLVRGAAVWALGILLPRAQFAALAIARRDSETDADVRQEWTAFFDVPPRIDRGVHS